MALLVLALGLLTAGAELLVRGAVGLARAAGVSSLLIGLTIVSFGTSTPELATSLRASLTGHADVAVGNVIGSNIFNIAVILGLTAMVCPIPVRRGVIAQGATPMVAVAVVPMTALASGNVITRPSGAVMLGLLGLYVAYTWRQGRRDPLRTAADLDAIPLAPRRSGWMDLGLVVAGLGLLAAATPMLLSSAVDLARRLGVSELVIALTVVAGGTSAPELMTSVVAGLRRQPDVAVGNVLGSNVFNVLGILGLCAVVEPPSLTRQTVVLDIPVMIAVSVACVPLMHTQGRVSRAEGAVLVGGWVVYTVVIYTLGKGWFV